ncbi:MAG: JAB domain-containing protein [Bacteroidales bacterium]|nr:JAB domain-containing protein [Bacteroidales bacterium]
MKPYLQISNSSQAANLLKEPMAQLDHEELWGIFLNVNCHLISMEMLTKGSLNTTVVDARTILRRALLNNAAKVIVAHNHPSENPTPSGCDIDQTNKIKKACSLMDIPLVDHIIITEDRYYSFAEEKVMNY